MDAIVMIGEQLAYDHAHPEEKWWRGWCNAWWWIGFEIKYPSLGGRHV